MLKLASLSLAALLALASPTLADKKTAPVAPKKECVSPEKFPNAERIEGAALDKFRQIAFNLRPEVSLVLVIRDPGIAIAFVKGCAVGYGMLGPVPSEKPKGDDGSI